MSWSPVQGLLPTVLDQETEETQPYAPKREQALKCGSNEEGKPNIPSKPGIQVRKSWSLPSSNLIGLGNAGEGVEIFEKGP
jgi:hypothetical protein